MYQPEPLLAQALLSRIRTIGKPRGHIDVAQFQFVGLARIREAYAARWREHEGRVRDIAQEFILKRIDSRDILLPAQDGYLLIFGSVTGSAAEMAANEIAQQMNEHFTGSGAAPGLTMKVQTRALTEDQLLTHPAMSGQAPTSIGIGQAERPTAKAGMRVKFMFQPVWTVSRESVANSYVAPYDSTTGTRIEGYQFERFSGPVPNFIEIDLLQLKVMELQLLKAREEGRRIGIGVSLHLTSVSRPVERARILAKLASLDRTLDRYRILKVTGLTPGFPRGALTEIATELAAYAPNIVLAASPDEADLATLFLPKVTSVGFALPFARVGRHGVPADAQLLSRVKAGVAMAHAVRRPFYVEGTISAQNVLEARACGVDYISSPLVWPPRSAPPQPFAAPLSRIQTLASGPEGEVDVSAA